jgi:hypothetical protein
MGLQIMAKDFFGANTVLPNFNMDVVLRVFNFIEYHDEAYTLRLNTKLDIFAHNISIKRQKDILIKRDFFFTIL